jgi:hypothetical protein
VTFPFSKISKFKIGSRIGFYFFQDQKNRAAVMIPQQAAQAIPERGGEQTMPRGKRRSMIYVRSSENLSGCVRSDATRTYKNNTRGLTLCSGRTCAMKSFIARFVTNQSGAVDFEDVFTVFAMIIGFIVALALMYATFVQLYVAISGMLPGYHWAHQIIRHRPWRSRSARLAQEAEGAGGRDDAIGRLWFLSNLSCSGFIYYIGVVCRLQTERAACGGPFFESASNWRGNASVVTRLGTKG